MTSTTQATLPPNTHIPQNTETSLETLSSAVIPPSASRPLSPTTLLTSLSLSPESLSAPTDPIPILPSRSSSALSPSPLPLVDSPLPLGASSTSTFSSLCLPHPSWSDPISGFVDDNAENMGAYAVGGFHPVCLGDIFNQRYTIVHKLGNGGHAVVWLAWDQGDARWVSLKIVQASQAGKHKELDFLRYLAQLGIDLEENFICPILDDFQIQGPNGCHVCMVFPFVGSSVLAEIGDAMTETREELVEMARQYGRQLAHAVALLHSVGIVHGDITAANVLTQISFGQSSLDELYEYTGAPERVVGRRWPKNPGCKYLVSPALLCDLPTNGRILLIDFGEAFWIGHPPARGLGIPITSATPEGLSFGAASPSSDIWAVACLLFHWWSGQHLFESENLDHLHDIDLAKSILDA